LGDNERREIRRRGGGYVALLGAEPAARARVFILVLVRGNKATEDSKKALRERVFKRMVVKQRQRRRRARKVYRSIGSVVSRLSGHHGDHRHVLIVAQVSSAFTPLVLKVERNVPPNRIQEPRHIE